MEKYRERNMDLYMVFLSLKKAYDNVSGEVNRRTLEARKVLEIYIIFIHNIYCWSTTCAQTLFKDK